VFGLLSQQHRPISRYGISVERLWSSALSGGSIDKSGGDSIEELADENIASSGRGLNVRGGAVHHVSLILFLEYFSYQHGLLILLDCLSFYYTNTRSRSYVLTCTSYNK